MLSSPAAAMPHCIPYIVPISTMNSSWKSIILNCTCAPVAHVSSSAAALPSSSSSVCTSRLRRMSRARQLSLRGALPRPASHACFCAGRSSTML